MERVLHAVCQCFVAMRMRWKIEMAEDLADRLDDLGGRELEMGTI